MPCSLQPGEDAGETPAWSLRLRSGRSVQVTSLELEKDIAGVFAFPQLPGDLVPRAESAA